MRTTTQIGKCTLCISCNLTVFQFIDQLNFILFASVAKHLQSISLGNICTNNSFFLCYQFHHLGFDSSKITVFNNSFTRIYVIVESIFNGRTDTEFNARVQLLQSFSHQVGT